MLRSAHVVVYETKLTVRVAKWSLYCTLRALWRRSLANTDLLWRTAYASGLRDDWYSDLQSTLHYRIGARTRANRSLRQSLEMRAPELNNARIVAPARREHAIAHSPVPGRVSYSSAGTE